MDVAITWATTASLFICENLTLSDPELTTSCNFIWGCFGMRLGRLWSGNVENGTHLRATFFEEFGEFRVFAFTDALGDGSAALARLSSQASHDVGLVAGDVGWAEGKLVTARNAGDWAKAAVNG